MKSMFQTSEVARVILVIIAAVVIGLLLVCTGNIIFGAFGLVFTLAGLAAFAAGWTYFPPKPKTGGVLTSGGEIIFNDKDETITVKGLVILADYFPFYLGAIPVDLSYVEWHFPMTILSVEKKRDGETKARQVALKESEVVITVVPDECDMADFIQAGRGSLEAIREQVAKIVYRETQKIVTYYQNPDGSTGLDAITISQQGNLVTDELEKLLNGAGGAKGIFEQKDFGVVCKKVQGDFPLPEDMIEKMNEAASIDYQNSSRMAEYDADAEAAKRLKTKLEAGDTSGTPLTPKESLDAVVQLRLVRDKNVKRVQMETIGKGGPITVVGTKVDFGD